MMARRSLLVGIVVFSVEAAADMTDTSQLQPWEVCGMCHGLSGNSVMAKFPKLAGQKSEYLIKQIQDFQRGARANDGGQMSAMVEELESHDLTAVAQYFAKQTRQFATTIEDPELYARGQTLFVTAPTSGVSCESCHGEPGWAIAPNLLGQHAQYLEKQMQDFQTGNRQTDMLDKSKQFAPFNDQDITALAYFLARGVLTEISPEKPEIPAF